MPEDKREIRSTKAPLLGGSVLNLYKRMGETPLARLERLREEKPHYALEVLSYAGRLDPMAEGVLLCLAGKENTRREAYLGLDKEYIVDILFGFSTDSYDILGRIMESGDTASMKKSKIEEGLNVFRGQFSQEYPPFSSKTIDGKTLFEWSRSGLIKNIVLPRKQVNIYDISILGLYKLAEPILYSYIYLNIEKLQGDFRQEEILQLWKRQLCPKGIRTFPCVTIKLSCSSGTYARALANTLGAQLGVPALALHILRTRVGEYSLEKSLR